MPNTTDRQQDIVRAAFNRIAAAVAIREYTTPHWSDPVSHEVATDKDLRSTGEHPIQRPDPVAEWRQHAQNWEGVARNMAQVLSNTIQWLDDRNREYANISDAELDALADTFRSQCAAHGVTP
jgi:hypothetical protein